MYVLLALLLAAAADEPGGPAPPPTPEQAPPREGAVAPPATAEPAPSREGGVVPPAPPPTRVDSTPRYDGLAVGPVVGLPRGWLVVRDDLRRRWIRLAEETDVSVVGGTAFQRSVRRGDFVRVAWRCTPEGPVALHVEVLAPPGPPS